MQFGFSGSSTTTTQQLQVSGLNLAASDCLDFDSLCASYFEAAVGGTVSESRNDTLYAEAAALIMCDTAKKTSARSFSQFEAQVEFSVTRNGAEVQSIELDTQLQYVTQAMSFAATAVQTGAAAGSVALAYLNVSDFCDTLSQDHTEAELALWDYTCGEGGVSSVAGGSAAASIAQAESLGSSVSAAFSGGAASTHVKVEGQDIDLFKAAIVTGAKTFSGTGSATIGSSFATAFSASVTGIESFREVCQDWIAGYCGGASISDLQLLVCAADSQEVCTNARAFVAAASDSFAVAYAEAASIAVSKSELTIGFEVCFVKDSNDEMVLDLLGGSTTPVGVFSTCL